MYTLLYMLPETYNIVYTHPTIHTARASLNSLKKQ